MVVLIRRLADNELDLLQPMFEAVFKHPVSLALLRWKYACQRGESWITQTADGHFSLHCGIYFRDALLSGRAVRVAQLVDLMAPPKARGLIRTESPFAILMKKILADLPRPDNPLGVALGFPSDRAMRLGEHMGVYRAVDQMMELEFEPMSRRMGSRWRNISSVTHGDAMLLNRAWKKMAGDLTEFSLGVRDVAYLQQRYLNHPEKKYTFLMVESFWLRQSIGLAVIGPGDERRELVDVVCAWKDVPEIIRTAQNWLADNFGKVLHLFLTERFARQLAPLAVRCESTQFRIMGNPFSPQSSIASQQGRWWLTGGDTDYR